MTNWDAMAKKRNIEPFGDFKERIKGGLLEAADQGEHVLVVSSGGVIATLANTALNLPKQEGWRMFTGIAHTSQHRFMIDDQGGLHLAQYGAVPHLDTPERREAITYT